MHSEMSSSKNQKRLLRRNAIIPEEGKKVLQNIIEEIAGIDQQFCNDLKAAFDQLGMKKT